MEDKIVTIKLRRSIKNRFREKEFHPRQTDEELLINLLDELDKKKK